MGCPHCVLHDRIGRLPGMEGILEKNQQQQVEERADASPKVPLVNPVRAYGTTGPTVPLAEMTIKRREPRPQDIQLEILYCGICHSDIHQARNEWLNSTYPCVPGHEIIGRVVKTGRAVKKFKEGDIAAVGCMVDSCRECPSCRDGFDNSAIEDVPLPTTERIPSVAGILLGVIRKVWSLMKHLHSG